MSANWNTRWGKRRVRHDPPTLAEALVAAQGLTDDGDQQIELAAMLMGVDVDEAKTEAARLASHRRSTVTIASTRDNGLRTIVVERRTSRRLIPRDLGTNLSTRDRATRDLAHAPQIGVRIR